MNSDHNLSRQGLRYRMQSIAQCYIPSHAGLCFVVEFFVEYAMVIKTMSCDIDYRLCCKRDTLCI